jgi:hypothetical protein
MVFEPDPAKGVWLRISGWKIYNTANALRNKIDFRLTTSPPLANLRRHEQYRIEFW